MIDAPSQPLRAKLSHLAIASPAPETLAAFYGTAMGMAIDRGSSVIIAQAHQRHLLFVEGERNTLGFAAYAVEGADEINALRKRCASRGISVMEHEDPLLLHGAIAINDPDGNKIVFGLRRESDRLESGLPARLQHFVIASTDARRISRFYQDVFGFVLSDEVIDDDGELKTAFLRCNNEHHSFAVFQAGRCRFDHHCYEVGDWGLIRDWGDSFARHEIPVQWGPGRHGPGNNLFLFVHDLDGNWLEISAELEVVRPDRPVGTWKHEQRTLNSWGSAPLRS